MYIVITGLVVAVRDHEHFRLKLLYTQKKKTDSENKQLKQDKDKLNVCTKKINNINKQLKQDKDKLNVCTNYKQHK